MSVRALSIVIVGAALCLAGCTQPADTAATGPGATAPAAAVPTPSSAAPAETSSGPSAATATAANASGLAANACPVSAATLFSALRKSEIYDQGGRPDGLAEPNCYEGFAYVRSTFKKAPQGEIAWVLFKFDSKAGEWQALNLGTGDVCDGFVSQAVRDRLNQGTGGGC